MIPIHVTDEHVLAFAQPSEKGEGNPEAIRHTFNPPAEMSGDCRPCEAVVHRDVDGKTAVIRVPLRLEPGEMTHLLRGGTVWLTTFGSLVPFAVEVTPGGDRRDHAEKLLTRREGEARRAALPERQGL